MANENDVSLYELVDSLEVWVSRENQFVVEFDKLTRTWRVYLNTWNETIEDQGE
jgi:hypothetical protein